MNVEKFALIWLALCTSPTSVNAAGPAPGFKELEPVMLRATLTLHGKPSDLVPIFRDLEAYERFLKYKSLGLTEVEKNQRRDLARTRGDDGDDAPPGTPSCTAFAGETVTFLETTGPTFSHVARVHFYQSHASIETTDCTGVVSVDDLIKIPCR